MVLCAFIVFAPFRVVVLLCALVCALLPVFALLSELAFDPTPSHLFFFTKVARALMVLPYADSSKFSYITTLSITRHHPTCIGIYFGINLGPGGQAVNNCRTV